MKLNKIAVGIALAAGTMAAQAADVVMFPYVVNSATVTTVVSVIDRGDAATPRYNASGVIGAFAAGGNRLHWRLNYKGNAAATDNAARCEEVNYYLPTSPNDIQTVDLGAHFGSTTSGVLFNDPSINNNWTAGIGILTYALASQAGAQARGVLFVHNADNVVGQTIQGDAMVFEFANGAAWGYSGVLTDNGAANTAAAFDYSALAAANSTTGTVVSFMPMAETTTRLFVTPVNDGVGAATSILDADGASLANVWDRLTARVGLVTGAGVAFDRDENLVSGSTPANVTCVGALDVSGLMTGGAAAVLASGGYGLLSIAEGTASTTGAAFENVDQAHIIKLEFSAAGTFNGTAVTGVFNNGFKLQ